MKKWLTTATLFTALSATFVACNKGDDNPYGDWRCTCFVKRYYFVNDTTKTFRNDTSIVIAENMDYNSGKTFCEKTQKNYVDTLGTSASCYVK